MRETWGDERVVDIDFKVDNVDGQVFHGLRVVVRPEIVTLELDPDLVSYIDEGNYITADELHKLYESGGEFYVLDVRNDYGAMIGRFRNAIMPKIRHFRDFPRVAEELSEV